MLLEAVLVIRDIEEFRKSVQNGHFKKFGNNRADKNAPEVIHTQGFSATITFGNGHSITGTKSGWNMTSGNKQIKQFNYNGHNNGVAMLYMLTSQLVQTSSFATLETIN